MEIRVRVDIDKSGGQSISSLVVAVPNHSSPVICDEVSTVQKFEAVSTSEGRSFLLLKASLHPRCCSRSTHIFASHFGLSSPA